MARNTFLLYVSLVGISEVFRNNTIIIVLVNRFYTESDGGQQVIRHLCTDS